MTRTSWVLLALVAASYVCDAYKILVVFPMPGKSHGILGEGVVRHLLNAGHEVTYITPFPNNKNPNSNLTQIDVSSNMKLFPENMLNIKALLDKTFDMDSQLFLTYIMNHIAGTTLEHEDVVKVFGDPKKHFDLVIAEWMFSELYAGIPAIFDVPLVWISTIEPHSMILGLVDEYLNPAYNVHSSPAIPPLSFTERLSELWDIVKMTFIRQTLIRYLEHRDYNHLIVPYIEQRGRVAPSFEELRYNASLVLGNSHVSMGQATRIPQIYKPIGGYHIDDKFKPLSEDLQKLMDNAKDGVIYFSMGSNLKSKDLPDSLKKDFFKIFGSLKQTVLWKFEEVFPDLPKNVHVLTWAPQQSILSHPNCVLFITHGGLLSTTETIHTGVPIIGIPVFADQFLNVERAVRKGFAKKVTLSYTMAGELKEAINEMLSDPKYRQKVKELSFIYHDRPVSPGAELVHWTEHVVKTGGAPHLRSAALLVPWYQKIYLDLLILLLIAGYTLKKLYNVVKPLVFKKKDDKKKKN